MWFCAHSIFYFRLIDDVQETYLVHENVYLIGADDPVSAGEVAERIGQENEDISEDGHLEVNQRKASYIYAGVRKLIEVQPHADEGKFQYLNGLELSYSVFEVDTLDEVRQLVNGGMVNILYRE